jgi:putative minor head protein
MGENVMSEIIFTQEQVDEMIEKTNYIIRYTTILDFDKFMEDYNRIKDLILKESYNIIKIVNSWKDDNVYKGIKTVIEKT